MMILLKLMNIWYVYLDRKDGFRDMLKQKYAGSFNATASTSDDNKSDDISQTITSDLLGQLL